MKHSPTRFQFSTAVIAAVAAASSLLSSSAHANLVVNGDFETAVISDSADGLGGVNSSGGEVSTKYGSLSGWDVGPSSNTPNALATNAQSYVGVGAGNGVHAGALSAAFPNSPLYDGYISQAVIGVVQDSIYKIGFWLSNQVGDTAENYMSVNWGGTITTPGDPISGGTYLSGGSPALPGAIPVPTAWTHYEFLVSGVTDARLSFIGGATPGAILLDDVTVDFVAVPEISSFGMITGLALLAFGTAARIRRRSPLTA